MYLLKLSHIFLVLCQLLLITCKQNFKGTSVEDVNDIKDFKKILRTKTNVLTLFINNQKRAAPLMKVFRDAADVVRGQGTMLLVDCVRDGRKLCKKLKVLPESYSLRHYKDGEFNKEYDRKETVQSIVNFMKDPTGDLPWEEEPSAANVTHLSDPQSLEKLLKKEHRPVMVMFYAPWCGFCKRMKPDYAAAASEVKDFAVMAAIDVNRPENAAIRVKHNITGFPTLLYFEEGILKHTYDGDNNKEKLVEFMKDPRKRSVKPRDTEWEEDNSAVKFLNSSNFDEFITQQPSVLVMFYAPWCGHCRKLKPEYEKAAAKVKELKLTGVMAAVDATVETDLASKYQVTGYPSVKYFKNGEFAYDVPGARDADRLIDFMKNPKKPRSPPPQEAPWSEETTEVVHLTTDNIKAELRKKRHGLVMFYAPWCGHCKNAKPEFTAAAEELRDNTRVILGAVDCSEHSTLCKLFDVKGYPTFKYFHYYNKATSDFNNGRTKSDFVKFINNADMMVKKLIQSKDEL